LVFGGRLGGRSGWRLWWVFFSFFSKKINTITDFIEKIS